MMETRRQNNFSSNDEDPCIPSMEMHWILSECYKWLLHGISLFACEFFYRVLIIPYEYYYNWQNYAPEKRFEQICLFSLTKYHISMKTYVWPIFIGLVAVLLWRGTENVLDFIFTDIYNFAIPYLILRACHFTYSNLELVEFIRGKSGLDYATGMASNYFHGYLHLQLPETGHTTKGLVERIEEYEATQNVIIPIKKLFILIPQSMYTKPKIDSKIMILARGLETVILDRAGVKRPFMNQVYRISECGPNQDKEWYVVLEGATPMMSFYEVLQHRSTATEEMIDMKRVITLQFYRALGKIIQGCPDTKDLVELVYYNDVTAEGKDVDVGEVVKERINTLIQRDKIDLS